MNIYPAQGTGYLAGLQKFCVECDFAPGEALRQKGVHYRDMYVVARGEVDIDLQLEASQPVAIEVGAGGFVGEIGFLRGTPANADAVARSAVRALQITDQTMAELERSAPELAVDLLRTLAKTAQDRTNTNLTLLADLGLEEEIPDLEILTCRNADMLREAQKLRYRVYCTELGRDSPAADHDQQTIADELDAFGHCFVAVRDSDVIGTIRVNFSREGPLGILEGLYGMAASDRHPATTAISTKFVIDRAYRGGLTAMRLIAQLAQYGDHQGIEECYGDAIPSLIDYYQAMGFEITGEAFFHRENGPSVPIRLDLTRHIEAMSSEAGVRRMLRAYVKSMREAAAAKAVTDAAQQSGETS